MPRRARSRSLSGIYHVIIRGMDRRIIFDETSDYSKFLNILEEYRVEHGFELYAYCLMNNHVHLMIREGTESISDTMKCVETKFAVWYNKKYGRVGYLFSERFRSEPVEDERYAMILFRYIHQNPIRAGLEKAVGAEYRWSSFFEYFPQKSLNRVAKLPNLISKDFISSFFDSEEKMSEFLHNNDHEKMTDFMYSSRMTDIEALQIMKEKYDCSGPDAFNANDPQRQVVMMKEMFAMGISVRQINRIAGVSRRKINKALGSASRKK